MITRAPKIDSKTLDEWRREAQRYRIAFWVALMLVFATMAAGVLLVEAVRRNLS